MLSIKVDRNTSKEEQNIQCISPYQKELLLKERICTGSSCLSERYWNGEGAGEHILFCWNGQSKKKKKKEKKKLSMLSPFD